MFSSTFDLLQVWKEGGYRSVSGPLVCDFYLILHSRIIHNYEPFCLILRIELSQYQVFIKGLL